MEPVSSIDEEHALRSYLYCRLSIALLQTARQQVTTNVTAFDQRHYRGGHHAGKAWYPGRVSRWRRILFVSFIAQLCALVGFSFVFPFLPLYIQTLGVHGAAIPLWAGVLGFSLSIAMALVAPLWGTLADRYGRKPMVVRAMTAGVFTTALLIVAPNIWAVLGLRILQGIFTGSVAASQALVASVTPRERMAFSMGLMQSAVFTGAAAGPFVGGFLDDHLGFHGTFAVGAAMLAVATLLVVFFVDEDFKRPIPEPGASRNPLVNLRKVASPSLLAMALVLFMSEFGNVVPAPVLALLAPHLSGVPVEHGIAQTPTTVGVILAVAGLCAAIAATQAQRVTNRFGYRRVLIVAMFLAGVFYIPAFFVGAVWQFVAVRALVGVCLGLAMPSASAIIGLMTPERQRASAYSVTSSASSFGIAFGPLVGGALSAVYGLRIAFLVTAFVLLLVSGVVSALVREPSAVEKEVVSPMPAIARSAATVSARSNGGDGGTEPSHNHIFGRK